MYSQNRRKNRVFSGEDYELKRWKEQQEKGSVKSDKNINSRHIKWLDLAIPMVLSVVDQPFVVIIDGLDKFDDVLQLGEKFLGTRKLSKNVRFIISSNSPSIKELLDLKQINL